MVRRIYGRLAGQRLKSHLEVIENILQKHLFLGLYPPTEKEENTLITHFPKDPSFEISRRTKITSSL